MSISEKPEPRTPPQRRLLKTDVRGIYKRGTRYVAITQFRGKRVKTYHRTKAEARRAKAERTAGARPTSRELFERYAERMRCICRSPGPKAGSGRRASRGPSSCARCRTSALRDGWGAPPGDACRAAAPSADCL